MIHMSFGADFQGCGPAERLRRREAAGTMGSGAARTSAETSRQRLLEGRQGGQGRLQRRPGLRR